MKEFQTRAQVATIVKPPFFQVTHALDFRGAVQHIETLVDRGPYPRES
jgi:hypothetical protein